MSITIKAEQPETKSNSKRGYTKLEADKLQIVQDRQAYFLREIETCRVKYLAGNKGDLPLAIRMCGEIGMPLQKWIVDAWADVCNAVFACETTWNDVLLDTDVPTTARRMELKRIELELTSKMIDLLPEYRQHAIDDYLFEALGKRLKITPRQARELYYDLPDGHRLEAKKERKPPPKRLRSKKLPKK